MTTKFLLSLLVAAQIPALAEEEKKSKSLLDRIPFGATSTNVTIPTLDKNKKRASVLTAKLVVVEPQDDLSTSDEKAKLTAKGIELYLFNKKEEIYATGKIESANFLLNEENSVEEEEERLVADGKIQLRSEDNAFEMRSQGGIFQLPTREGLFLGPGYTLFTDLQNKKTAMNLHPILPLAATLQLLIATPPPEISAEELSQFERLVAPRLIPSPNLDELQASADAANLKLAERMANYLAAVGKTALLTQVKAPVVIDPLDAELKDNQTSIEFDGGAYFDGDNLEIVYLGNITLKRTTFTVTCDKDLKVILEEADDDEDKDKKNKEEEKKKSAFTGLGELKQLTASGNLKVTGIDEKGDPVVMKGDRALYDKAKQSLLIRGDNLYFQKGDSFVGRASHKDAYISAKFDGKRIRNAQLSKNGWKFKFPDPEKKKK